MRFCPNCDNILIPRNKKLYCKACNQEFELDKETEEYKIVKKIKHDEKESAPIVVKEVLKNDRISAQDRKAFEEFFSGSEMDSY
jgi:DNA-directed RNA polymerase subunit M/transcription elongation factor TFIIS